MHNVSLSSELGQSQGPPVAWIKHSDTERSVQGFCKTILFTDCVFLFSVWKDWMIPTLGPCCSSPHCFFWAQAPSTLPSCCAEIRWKARTCSSNHFRSLTCSSWRCRSYQSRMPRLFFRLNDPQPPFSALEEWTTIACIQESWSYLSSSISFFISHLPSPIS